MRGRIVAVGVAVVVIIGAVLVARAMRGAGGPARGPITAESIVMLGDSITEQGDWPALLPAVAVVNQGYSGFTTAQLVAEAETVAAAGPAVVFVLTGTNDIRDGLPPATTVEHLSTILDRFAEASPDTMVVVQTVLPRADAVSRVVGTNMAIRALADGRDEHLLDLYPAFDDGSGALRVGETTDGVHLADAGYQRWRGLLVETLTELGLETL